MHRASWIAETEVVAAAPGPDRDPESVPEYPPQPVFGDLFPATSPSSNRVHLYEALVLTMQLAARRFKKFRLRPLLLGIDPIVVMKDIAGAGQEQALDALEWTAPALVKAALGAGSPVPRAGKRASAGKRVRIAIMRVSIDSDFSNRHRLGRLRSRPAVGMLD
jgi:hypothetical protein